MWLWIEGFYTFEAMEKAIVNAFRKEGQAPIKYRERPILKDINEKTKELTEEERKAQVSILFNELEMMKNSFEKAHGDEKWPT